MFLIQHNATQRDVGHSWALVTAAHQCQSLIHRLHLMAQPHLRKSSIEASLWLPGDFFLFTFGDLGQVATAPLMTVGLRLTASCVFCLSRSVIP